MKPARNITEEYISNVDDAHPLAIGASGITFAQLSDAKLKKKHAYLMARDKEIASFKEQLRISRMPGPRERRH
nr:hypothetical protein Q903MT_gene2720 [Picea sitchensis]